MLLPPARGPVSRHVVDALQRTDPDDRAVPGVALGTEPVTTSVDAQLALWLLYELHYRGFDDVEDDREWDPGLLGVRRQIEARFERELREATAATLAGVAEGAVGDGILALVGADTAPSVAAFLHRSADREDALDYLRQRSVQQLKESDPQSFLLPRLAGTAKVALAEIQYDEYGGGRPERLHQRLYAEALAAADLDPAYGAYVGELTALSFASANVMSMFTLNRRLRGAALGHFAAFEASSSVPSRKVAAGLERLGFDATVTRYFDEHVEADAVHEQVACHDICDAFVEQEPGLREDVLFGAASVLHLDALSAAEFLDRWQSGEQPEAVAS